MEPACTPSPEIHAQNSQGRWLEVNMLSAFREMQQTGASLSQVAKEQGIPESTMRHWVNRAQETPGPKAWTDFFEWIASYSKGRGQKNQGM
jgi:hypothetical protein